MSRFEQRKRASAFRCRCRKCEARAFMELHPSSYTRALRCHSCGHCALYRDEGWRVDWYRTSKAEATRQGVCECYSAPFPHRPGSRFKRLRCEGMAARWSSRRVERARVAA